MYFIELTVDSEAKINEKSFFYLHQVLMWQHMQHIQA